MTDKFGIFHSNIDSPGYQAENVTPNDTAGVPGELTTYSRTLYVGGDGNINCIMAGDTANTLFTAVSAGSILPIRVKKIWAAGTMATNIVNIW